MARITVQTDNGHKIAEYDTRRAGVSNSVLIWLQGSLEKAVREDDSEEYSYARRLWNRVLHGP